MVRYDSNLSTNGRSRQAKITCDNEEARTCSGSTTIRDSASSLRSERVHDSKQTNNDQTLDTGLHNFATELIGSHGRTECKLACADENGSLPTSKPTLPAGNKPRSGRSIERLGLAGDSRPIRCAFGQKDIGSSFNKNQVLSPLLIRSPP